MDGQPVLEPAFQIVTRPSLPARRVPTGSRAGPPTAHGSSASASPRSRSPRSHGDAHFAFAVPLQPERAAQLNQVRLSRFPGRVPVSLRAAPGAASRPAQMGWRCARRASRPAAWPWNGTRPPTPWRWCATRSPVTSSPSREEAAPRSSPTGTISRSSSRPVSAAARCASQCGADDGRVAHRGHRGRRASYRHARGRRGPRLTPIARRRRRPRPKWKA